MILKCLPLAMGTDYFIAINKHIFIPNVGGQPARVAGLGEPHDLKIFLSGCLASGITNKRPSPEDENDDSGLSLGRGRIKDLCYYEFFPFSGIVSHGGTKFAKGCGIQSLLFIFRTSVVCQPAYFAGLAQPAGSAPFFISFNNLTVSF